MTCRQLRLAHIFREIDVRGRPDELVLSVYRDHGVVPKSSRDDNFNKTPVDTSLYKLVMPDDFVINKMKAWQGSVARSDYRGIVSGDYLVCRVVSREVIPSFLHFLLRSQPLINEYRKRSSGIRPSQWRLYWEDFREIEVGIPFLTLQRVTAYFLDTETARIDALIDKKRRMIELVEARFAVAVVHAVTGSGLPGSRRHSGIDWTGDVPTHWGTPWLGANFHTQLGKMLNAEAASGPEQFRYVRNTNVQWDRFELDDLATMHFGSEDRTRCDLRAGDLLVCEGGEVGRSAVWPGEPAEVYFQKAIHRVRPFGSGNTRFLMYCLRAAAHMNVFIVEGNQSTIVHLTGEKLREHRFPFPPSEEQEQIVQTLDSRRDQVAKMTRLLRQQIALLQEHRQALITAAVTGELDVPGVAA